MPSHTGDSILPAPPAEGTVYWVAILLPSEAIPSTFTAISLPDSEIMTVCSFGGAPLLNLVFPGFIFHVPTNGSAAISRAANPVSMSRSLMLRMGHPPLGVAVEFITIGGVTPFRPQRQRGVGSATTVASAAFSHHVGCGHRFAVDAKRPVRRWRVAGQTVTPPAADAGFAQDGR